MDEKASHFTQTVIDYVERVLDACQDHYGEPTPLLTEGLDLDTGNPIQWQEHILSNLACQQNFVRTLDGLSALTGDDAYRARAEEWVRFALSVITDPASGLFYWGGHTSYDINQDRPLIGNHELKCVYPYYGFLYELAPQVTQRFVEALWNRHMKDWSTLLFNRHGEYREWDTEHPWEHTYRGGPLPIVENSMLSFINTGSDLIYAATQLFHLSGAEPPLVWAKRLLHRYEEVRNPKTGLGGYQFNHRDPCRVRISFRSPFSERSDVNEATVITSGTIQTRYGRAAITWMNLFEDLGDEGREFLNIACHDLQVLKEYAYDADEHVFYPLLADGTRLSPKNCIEGAGYCSPRGLAPVAANGVLFLAYARAYRLTGDLSFWQVARGLAQGIGWNTLWEHSTEGSARLDTHAPLSLDPWERSVNQDALCALFGLLDLWKATQQEAYLSLATEHACQMIEASLNDGLFTSSKQDRLARIDHPLPVGLLHVVAALAGSDVSLPRFYPNSTSFDPKVIISRSK